MHAIVSGHLCWQSTGENTSQKVLPVQLESTEERSHFVSSLLWMYLLDLVLFITALTQCAGARALEICYSCYCGRSHTFLAHCSQRDRAHATESWVIQSRDSHLHSLKHGLCSDQSCSAEYHISSCGRNQTKMIMFQKRGSKVVFQNILRRKMSLYVNICFVINVLFFQLNTLGQFPASHCTAASLNMTALIMF